MKKFTPQDQQSIVNILLRYWQQIVAIEESHGLVVGKGDMRARIEYFHDAIRAYTASDQTEQMESRLAVEQLSYDVKCLRYIAGMPLASITHDSMRYSASTLPAVTEPRIIEKAEKMKRDVKEELRELYEKYGVLFASLLRVTAENDYYDRADHINQQVEEINQIIEAIKAGAGAQQLESLIQHLEDEAIKRDLLTLLPQIKGKGSKAVQALIAKLQASIQRKDNTIKTIDTAYHEYTTSQLMIYETSQSMLKQLAGQGMNLVGQFVESALRGGVEQVRGR